VAKAAGQSKSPLLRPPCQRPTLQLRNVLARLPRQQQAQTASLMRAAWKMNDKEGMAARWSAAAFLEIEKSFRKIMGYRDLWALKAILDGLQPATGQAVA